MGRRRGGRQTPVKRIDVNESLVKNGGQGRIGAESKRRKTAYVNVEGGWGNRKQIRAPPIHGGKTDEDSGEEGPLEARPRLIKCLRLDRKEKLKNLNDR